MTGKTLPSVTPEMVAAMANLCIEARHEGIADAVRDGARVKALQGGQSAWRTAFQQSAEVEFDENNEGHHLLMNAALELAYRLNFPAPYRCEVRDQFGAVIDQRNRTLSYFYDGEGFTQADCAAVAALDPGTSYVVNGAHATMTVTRAG